MLRTIMKTTLILDNIRSCQNVGSILRTADCFGINEVVMCGYTPYPLAENDKRLPYVAEKINKRIVKASLGAEHSVRWTYQPNIHSYINKLKQDIDCRIVAIEQDPESKDIAKLKPKKDTYLILGNELEGVNKNLLKLCDNIYEIKLCGSKESLNVAIATAIACYQLVYDVV